MGQTPNDAAQAAGWGGVPKGLDAACASNQLSPAGLGGGAGRVGVDEWWECPGATPGGAETSETEPG